MQETLLLGFDIGGTKCAAVLGRADAANGVALLERSAFLTADAPGPEAALSRLSDLGERLLQRHGAARPRAIGVTCGGPLDSARGLVLGPPNLPGWDHVDVAATLAGRFGAPVRLENDANAGALAEGRWGAARGCRNFVFLTFGTGMGAGLVLDGRLYRGARDLAGEVGHVRLRSQGPAGHGKHGSFEGFCSGGGIARALAARGATLGSAQALGEAARAGDGEARALLDEIGERLGEGLAIVADLLDPERIVVGGIFTRLEELLRPAMERSFAREALDAARVAVVPAALGDAIGDHACLAAALGRVGSERGTWRALEAHRAALETLAPALEAAAPMVIDTLRAGGKVLACGNGGSAAQAQHLVSELVGRYLSDRRSLPALWLGGDAAQLTCIANDFAWEESFARPLTALAAPGDLLVCFSTSGRSPNVLRALEEARARGIASLAFLGKGGGPAAAAAARAVVIDSDDTARVQEAHLFAVHWLCDSIEEAFR